MSVINKLLFHALLLFLMVGSMAGLFVGVALVLRPAWLLHANRYANRWIDLSPIANLLDQVIKVDHWFYRHHKASGISLLAGAVVLIYLFTVRFDKFSILIGLSRKFPIPPAFVEVLLDSVVLGIMLGATASLIISMFLLIRPSMLRGFEQDANQWISMRRFLVPFELYRDGVDEYVFQNVQMTGVLLLFGSLYTLAGLTIWL
jgi:hypothetical protein